MSELIVSGVDFSGAKTIPNGTWLAISKLGPLGLELIDVRKVGSHALVKELNDNKSLAAVGIDAPFSLPVDFLSFMAAKGLRPDYQSWQEIAEQLAFTSFEDFQALVVEFKKEPKRICDKSASALSPLHRGYPTMVQMTYQCIRGLAMLDPKRFFVLPFQQDIPLGTAVLEVYPRQVLQYFGLANVIYKGKDKSELEKTQNGRKTILSTLTTLREKKGLTFKDCPRITVPKKFEHTLMDSDHALDAFIACIATALWRAAPQLFSDPLSGDDLDVLLEGWIYGPQMP